MADTLKGMADSMYWNVGDACLDSAYLARGICDTISKKMGRTPYIKPKRNTSAKSMGSHSWRKMVLMLMNDRDRFDTHCHQRSIAEAVFAALKERRGRGGSLRSRITHTQNRELAVRAIS